MLPSETLLCIIIRQWYNTDWITYTVRICSIVIGNKCIIVIYELMQVAAYIVSNNYLHTLNYYDYYSRNIYIDTLQVEYVIVSKHNIITKSDVPTFTIYLRGNRGGN